MKKLIMTAVAFLLVGAGFAALGNAQAIDGNLLGVVQDATGAVIPSVNLVLENMGTAVRYTTKSDANGGCRFNNVPVGLYKITASDRGFANAVVQHIKIQLIQNTTIHHTITVIGRSTTVNGPAPPPDLEIA